MAGRNRKGAITTTIARTGARRSQAFADNEPPDRVLIAGTSPLWRIRTALDRPTCVGIIYLRCRRPS
jgi:hypothetical protein